MTEAAKLARYGPVVATVGSRSNPGAVPYDIRRNPNGGELSCNCKAFAFQRQCRHIDGVLRDTVFLGEPSTREAAGRLHRERVAAIRSQVVDALAPSRAVSDPLSALLMTELKRYAFTIAQARDLATKIRELPGVLPVTSPAHVTPADGIRRIVLDD